jgi:hypothetical protein
MAYINTVETDGIQAGTAAVPPLATVDLWPSLDPTKPFTLQTTGVNNFIAVTNQIGANFNLGLTNSFGADLTFGASSAFGLDGCFAGVVDAEPFKLTFEPSAAFSSAAGALNGVWTTRGSLVSNEPDSTSDIRLKKNVQPLTNCLDKVLSMQGVEFNWNEFAPPWMPQKNHEVGFIAQQMQEVVPEVVKSMDSYPGGIIQEDGLLMRDIMTIDYGKLTAVLAEAIKEQQTQIEELKKTVQELSTKLAECCP